MLHLYYYYILYILDYKGRISYSPDNGRITIQNLKISDEGNIELEVILNNGTILRDKISLKILSKLVKMYPYGYFCIILVFLKASFLKFCDKIIHNRLIKSIHMVMFLKIVF